MMELTVGMKVRVKISDGDKSGVITKVNNKTVVVQLDENGRYIVRDYNQVIWSAQ